MHTLDDLLTRFPNRVLFTCLAGSQAYGTAGPESDEDLRGVYVVPAAEYLRLEAPLPQLADERSNVVYFSLRRVLELLAVANPNVLELLFMPADCVRATSPEMAELVAHRQLFLTRQCADTHLGYAVAQIKRARGQNKWVNNPQPEERPRREGFCYVIPKEQLAGTPGPPAVLPMRPLPLARTGWDLKGYEAARVEHAHDLFRLYLRGAESRGVFRGEEVACQPIPLEEEIESFAGLLLYNDAAYRQALRDHQQYWQWRGARNEERWRRQESGELDFDAKNLMHTVRLLLSGRSILARGEPIVRFEGEVLALLLKIRAGELAYEEILSLAEGLMAECEALKRTTSLPPEADRSRVETLLAELHGELGAEAGMRERIAEVLEELAKEHQVRVLYAVESGSRAWGFASPDSDFDVRFLYVHRPEWYLRVNEGRDVIEAMLPGDLDFAGWELRKALRLFAKGNAPLYEWLGSPIVYAEAPGFATELRTALPAVFNPAPVLHQYLGQAGRILDVDLRPEQVRLKRIFYFLRPLFAARWVAHRRSMAPTPFRELLEAPWTSAEEREWVEVLLAAKIQAAERDAVALAPERKAWMRQELERLQALVPSLARQGELPMAMLDELLWRWVMGQ